MALVSKISQLVVARVNNEEAIIYCNGKYALGVSDITALLIYCDAKQLIIDITIFLQ